MFKLKNIGSKLVKNKMCLQKCVSYKFNQTCESHGNGVRIGSSIFKIGV